MSTQHDLFHAEFNRQRNDKAVNDLRLKLYKRHAFFIKQDESYTATGEYRYLDMTTIEAILQICTIAINNQKLSVNISLLAPKHVQDKFDIADWLREHCKVQPWG